MLVMLVMVALKEMMGAHKLLAKDKNSFISTLRIRNPYVLLLKLIIIFVPIFSIAFFTNKMVFVLPTLAVGLIVGTAFDGLDISSKGDEENEDANS